MRKLDGVAVLGGLLGLAGCQGAPAEPVSYVVLDQQAREAGFTVDGVEKVRSAVLPLEATPAAELSVVGPKGKTRITPEADGVVLVHGPSGAIEQKKGHEVDLDRIVVKGSEEAARELAIVLAGKLERLSDGSFEIRAINAFGEASRVREPAGLLEVLPGEGVATPAERSAARSEPGGIEGARQSIRGAFVFPASAQMNAVPSAAEPELDGLAWDALLPPQVSCDDPAAGTWVSYEYHPNMGEWYVVTAHLRHERPGSLALVGDVRSEFWMGGPTDSKAPPCDEAAHHGAVDMPARGSIEGTRLEVHTTSYKVDSNVCVSSWQGDYSPDHFTGSIDGASLHSVNNDGHRAVDDPTRFRRVSCK